MSIRIMSRVWDDSDAEGTTLLVLLSLADQANDEGWCWPGQATIQRRTKLSERSIRRALRWLEDHGELEVERRGNHRTNMYRVLTGQPDRATTQHTDRPDSPPRPATPDRSRPANLTAPIENRQVEPSEEPSVEIAATIEARPTVAAATVTASSTNPHWDALESLFGYRPRGNEASLWGRLVKAAKEHPPEEISRRAGLYAITWPNAALTPAALDKHWDWLGSQVAQMSTSDREQLADRARRAERKRRLAATESVHSIEPTTRSTP